MGCFSERNAFDLHVRNMNNWISVDFIMALSMELWECNMEMSRNEGREEAYRMSESDFTPAWMGPDNALAVQIQQVCNFKKVDSSI